MKNLIFISAILVLVLSGLFGCDSNMNNSNIIPGNDEPNDNIRCEDIILSESDFKSAESDDYVVTDSRITNDSLMIEVQYDGGCGPTNFDLITDGLFMESNPVKLNVILAFDDEDPCEMLVTRTLCFDLSNLATYYNNSYQTMDGKIVLYIIDYNTITYHF